MTAGPCGTGGEGLVRQARVGLLGVSSSPVLLPGSPPLSGTSSPAGREIEAAVALQFVTWAEKQK